MSNIDFFANLSCIEDWTEITNLNRFTPMPDDWWIVITDITGSTQAIANGRYKDVNLIGACSIIALLNVASEIEIPFVFGGDGATVLIPPQLLLQAKSALLGTQAIAWERFSLNLRVGLVPVAELSTMGHWVEIAKLRISENYEQAVFIGGGLTYATDLVKGPQGDRYQLKQGNLTPNADFSGLECRWQDIPSQHGETVSLLVQATGRSRAREMRSYQEVIRQIRRIYGSDEAYHPVRSRQLRLTFSRKNLASEIRAKTLFQSWIHPLFYLLKLQIENALGWVFMTFRLNVEGMDWGKYQQIVIDTTDYKKFDDMLRMVIAGNAVQRERLTCYLESRYQQGDLVYGVHISDRALMTCLVFERNGRQVHFIDGADGGYALAAQALKMRLKRRSLVKTASQERFHSSGSDFLKDP